MCTLIPCTSNSNSQLLKVNDRLHRQLCGPDAQIATPETSPPGQVRGVQRRVADDKKTYRTCNLCGHAKEGQNTERGRTHSCSVSCGHTCSPQLTCGKLWAWFSGRRKECESLARRKGLDRMVYLLLGLSDDDGLAQSPPAANVRDPAMSGKQWTETPGLVGQNLPSARARARARAGSAGTWARVPMHELPGPSAGGHGARCSRWWLVTGARALGGQATSIWLNPS